MENRLNKNILDLYNMVLLTTISCVVNASPSTITGAETNFNVPNSTNYKFFYMSAIYLNNSHHAPTIIDLKNNSTFILQLSEIYPLNTLDYYSVFLITAKSGTNTWSYGFAAKNRNNSRFSIYGIPLV